MFVLWQSDKCVNVRQQNIVSSTTVQDVIECSCDQEGSGPFLFCGNLVRGYSSVYFAGNP